MFLQTLLAYKELMDITFLNSRSFRRRCRNTSWRRNLGPCESQLDVYLKTSWSYGMPCHKDTIMKWSCSASLMEILSMKMEFWRKKKEFWKKEKKKTCIFNPQATSISPVCTEVFLFCLTNIRHPMHFYVRFDSNWHILQNIPGMSCLFCAHSFYCQQ